jgi:chromosome segregation ATPase
MVYEERLTQQEEEHEMEIRELNLKHKTQIDGLKKHIADLKTDNETFRRDFARTVETNEQSKKKLKEKEEEIKKNGMKLSDQATRIELLQKELEEDRENLRKKEKKIYEYKYKIND